MTDDASAATLTALTARLSFPRRTGTDGNDRARALIMSELKTTGYDVTEEGFWYMPRQMQAINFSLSLCLIVANYGIFAIIWFQIDAFAWLVTILAVWMLALLFLQYSMPLRWRMQATVEGTAEPPSGAKQGINIIARLESPVPSDSEPVVLVIGAHHDSISLLYPPALNIFIFICNSLGVLVAGILAIIEGSMASLAGSTNPWFRVVIVILCLLTCCTLVAKLANKRTNHSDGAVDNATGCAVLLELARACKVANDASRFSEVRFVFFDAEEEGLWGSCFHAVNHEEELKQEFKGGACFISLDEPGGRGTFVASSSFGFPRISRPRDDSTLAAFTAGLMRVSKRGLSGWMPYPASDHAPFVEIGIPSTWISHACINANTSRDTMEGVSGEHMNVVLQELVGFVKNVKMERPGSQADT